MLGYDIAQALPELRAHAESRMSTPCVVRVPVEVMSDERGRDVTTYSQPVFEGLCRIRNRGNSTGREVESGDSTVAIHVFEWHVPHHVDSIPRGAVIFLEGVPRYRVTQAADGDDETARRYPIEAVQ